jgi:hypothetical protein
VIRASEWNAVAPHRLKEALAPISPFRVTPMLRPPLRWLRSSTKVPTTRRYLSDLARYPNIQNFASSLARSQPHFSLPPENIHILSTPAEFYTQLIVSHLFRWFPLTTNIFSGLNPRRRTTNIHFVTLHRICGDGTGERGPDINSLQLGLTPSDRDHT